MYNILILDFGKYWGGVETYTYLLCRGLLSRGINVHVFCMPDSPLCRKLQLLGGVKIHESVLLNSGDLRPVAKLVECCIRNRIDVIHANWGKEYWVGVLSGKLAGSRVVVTRHVEEKLNPLTAVLIKKFVDKVIVPSKSIFKVLSSQNIDKEKIVVINHGVDTEQFSPDKITKEAFREKLNLPKGSYTVGILSNLVSFYGKGHRTLLMSLAEICKVRKDVYCIIMGGGRQLLPLRRFAERLGVADNVKFLGHVESPEYMLPGLDVFVLLSYEREGFGFVILEAMSSGVPVICSTIGGGKEIVSDGVDGYIISPDDYIALRDKILQLINSEDERMRFSRAARENAVARFSYLAMVEKTIKVYSEVLDKKCSI